MNDSGGAYAVLGLVMLALCVCLYLLPGIVASSRRHPQAGAIWVLDILLGWSVIGWVGALVWACTNSERIVVPAPAVMPVPAPAPATSSMADEIAALAKLRDQGVLTEEEFIARKRRLLGEPGPAVAGTPPPEV